MGESPSSTPPVWTTTVWTTVLHTTFVTLPPVVPSTTQSPPAFTTPDSQTTTFVTFSSSTISTSSKAAASSSITTALPIIVTKSAFSPSGSPPSVAEPTTMTTTATATSSPSKDARSPTNKHAIIGGLCAAIAGFLLLGFLLFFCLRRRRRKREGRELIDSTDEKDMRPSFIRKWSDFPRSRFLSSPPPVHSAARNRTPVIDDNVIRVSSELWRPFVGREGLRESMPAAQLRCTNPDPSAQSTPASVVASNYFFVRQRDATATAFIPSQVHQRFGEQRPQPQHWPKFPPPVVTVDPALSRECVVFNQTPSFRSYPSFSTSPVIVQKPPEDPFLATPGHSQTPWQQKRPNLAPLQSAGRTLSNLNPFRAKSTQMPVPSTRTISSSTVTSIDSGWTSTRTRSDPFDLDKRFEATTSAWSGVGGTSAPSNTSHGLNVYEGT